MLENVNTANGRLGSLLAALGIRHGEGVAVSMLIAQSFLLSIAFFALYTAGTAIFLSHFDAGAIAYVYVIAAVLLIGIGVFFNRLEQQIPFPTLLLGSVGSLLLLFLLLRVGLWATASSAAASWVAFLLIVTLRVSWTLMNLVIWALAGRLFNVRQSKRLFPLIVVGTVSAIIIGGLVNGSLVALMGIPNLLWIAVGGTMGMMVLLAVTLRIFQKEVATPSQRSRSSQHGDTRKRAAPNDSSWLASFRDRYILWIVAFSALSTLATYLLEFVFIREANSYYQDATAYANFFGTYLGVTTLILLIVSLLSGLLFERLGLRVGLQSNSAIVTLFASFFVLCSLIFGEWRPLFWLVVLTKLSDDVLVVAMSNTAARVLYQPVAASRRVWLQTVIESIVVPSAIGLVGLFLIGLQFVGELSTRQLFLILIVLGLGWFFASFKVHGVYLDTLRGALLQRRLTAVDRDESTGERVRVLAEGLQSEHPAVVLYSLNMLAETDSPEREKIGNLDQVLLKLLNHEAEVVRLNVAQRLGQPEWLPQETNPLDWGTWVKRLQEQLVVEPSTTVRAALCQSLIAQIEATGELDVSTAASAYLSHPDRDLRSAAVIGLLRHGGIQGVLMAGPKLLELVHSADQEERVRAAQVVGKVGEIRFFQPLVSLLADDEIAVRRAALQASSEVRNGALWPLVGQCLTAASTRRQATHALVQGGEAALPTIAKLFAIPEQTSVVQVSLARAVGQIGASDGSREAVNLLWRWTSRSDHPKPVQREIWRGLRRSRTAADAAQRKIVLAQIEGELTHISWLCGAWEMVNQRLSAEVTDRKRCPMPNLLLEAAIVDEVSQTRSALFDLLSSICDGPVLLRIRSILERVPVTLPDANAIQANSHRAATRLPGDDEQHAYAQEILDELLPPTLKQLLAPLLSGDLDVRLRKALQKAYPAPEISYVHWLLTLINTAESRTTAWTKVCAIYAAKQVIDESGRVTDEPAPGVGKTTLRFPEPEQFALLEAIQAHRQSREPLIREAAQVPDTVVA